MNPHSLPKPPLIADAAFGIALAVLYLGFVLAFQGIQSEISTLFLASYALLGLGTLFFYLLFSTNSNLALIIHTWLFPLFCLLNLFLRWLPSVIIVGRAEINTFFGSVLIYVLLLFAFFIVQSNLRTRYRPVE
jgi:hypothetical protein